ncbi:MAG: phosphatase [Eubacterium sp.]|nr:phosphatase [Eubacterium sp.]
MDFELDVHTHTIASGHAYGTLTEMAREASVRGLKILGITEHAHNMPGTCDDLYFVNLRVVPREMFGIRLMLGAELNIMDYEGTIDLPDWILDRLDIKIASIHGNLYRMGTMEQNTAAVLGAMRNPRVDIIGHPDDGNCPLDYERIVLASKEYHTLLEINNNSLRMQSRKNAKENITTILKLCKKYEVPVVMNSDAHFMVDIANTDHSMALVEEVDFPKELILNYSAEKFETYIAENRMRRC